MGGIQPGDICFTVREIKINDQLAFEQHERILVERVQPNPQSPQYKFVVFSVKLQKRFQLRDVDLTQHALKPEGTSVQQADGPPRVEPPNRVIPDRSQCIHQYTALPDGSIQCSKCGSKVESASFRLPEVPEHCGQCGADVGAQSIVCGVCGSPNADLIVRNARLSHLDTRRCRHDLRYVDNGMMCIICGLVLPLKSQSQRMLYARALGKQMCIYCGAQKPADRNYCEICGKPFVEITALSNDRLIYDPKEAAMLDKQVRYEQRNRNLSPDHTRNDLQSSGTESPPVPPNEDAPLPVQTSSTPVATHGDSGQFCTECGELLEGNNKYCTNCGSVIVYGASPFGIPRLGSQWTRPIPSVVTPDIANRDVSHVPQGALDKLMAIVPISGLLLCLTIFLPWLSMTDIIRTDYLQGIFTFTDPLGVGGGLSLPGYYYFITFGCVLTVIVGIALIIVGVLAMTLKNKPMVVVAMLLGALELVVMAIMFIGFNTGVHSDETMRGVSIGIRPGVVVVCLLSLIVIVLGIWMVRRSTLPQTSPDQSRRL